MISRFIGGLICLTQLAFCVDYIIIDLEATNSPCVRKLTVSDHMLPEWSDEYKTRYIVLRKIEVPIITDNTPALIADLAPTNTFYIGVYEVTQRQWELVMGDRPSYFRNEEYYRTRPVEQIDFDTVRGSNGIEKEHFIGKLRTLTKLETIDLPTEKQWEYSCRAGTTTPFHNGRILSEGWDTIPGDWCNDVARTADNTSNVSFWKPGKGQTKMLLGFGYFERKLPNSTPKFTGTQSVGYYMPNTYGLYDMHGNVAELCLDWFDKDNNQRVIRGGGWLHIPRYCTSSYRARHYCNALNRSQLSCQIGFRIVLNCIE